MDFGGDNRRRITIPNIDVDNVPQVDMSSAKMPTFDSSSNSIKMRLPTIKSRDWMDEAKDIFVSVYELLFTPKHYCQAGNDSLCIFGIPPHVWYCSAYASYYGLSREVRIQRFKEDSQVYNLTRGIVVVVVYSVLILSIRRGIEHVTGVGWYTPFLTVNAFTGLMMLIEGSLWPASQDPVYFIITEAVKGGFMSLLEYLIQ